MDIIKRGKLPEEGVATFSCNNCRSTLSAKRHEGDYISDQRDGDCIKFKCPVCGLYIYVDDGSFR